MFMIYDPQSGGYARSHVEIRRVRTRRLFAPQRRWWRSRSTGAFKMRSRTTESAPRPRLPLCLVPILYPVSHRRSRRHPRYPLNVFDDGLNG
jgi:hypothetical protein